MLVIEAHSKTVDGSNPNADEFARSKARQLEEIRSVRRDVVKTE